MAFCDPNSLSHPSTGHLIFPLQESTSFAEFDSGAAAAPHLEQKRPANSVPHCAQNIRVAVNAASNASASRLWCLSKVAFPSPSFTRSIPQNAPCKFGKCNLKRTNVSSGSITFTVRAVTNIREGISCGTSNSLWNCTSNPCRNL